MSNVPARFGHKIPPTHMPWESYGLPCPGTWGLGLGFGLGLALPVVKLTRCAKGNTGFMVLLLPRLQNGRPSPTLPSPPHSPRSAQYFNRLRVAFPSLPCHVRCLDHNIPRLRHPEFDPNPVSGRHRSPPTATCLQLLFCHLVPCLDPFSGGVSIFCCALVFPTFDQCTRQNFGDLGCLHATGHAFSIHRDRRMTGTCCTHLPSHSPDPSVPTPITNDRPLWRGRRRHANPEWTNDMPR